MDNLDPCILFGQKLKEIRVMVKISQEELAGLANLDRTYISSVERGKRNISIRNIFKLANALNIPPYQLIDFDSTSHLKEQ